MSPGVNPRPSLNGLHVSTHLRSKNGVAGGEPPALIERSRSVTVTTRCSAGVAGGEPPALIERCSAMCRQQIPIWYGVAGGEPPALIER